jgi:hypothetical protein
LRGAEAQGAHRWGGIRYGAEGVDIPIRAAGPITATGEDPGFDFDGWVHMASVEEWGLAESSLERPDKHRRWLDRIVNGVGQSGTGTALLSLQEDIMEQTEVSFPSRGITCRGLLLGPRANRDRCRP